MGENKGRAVYGGIVGASDEAIVEDWRRGKMEEGGVAVVQLAGVWMGGREVVES
ncbi:hypothetical protein TWF694_005579 [Orbilia ellipsospora]|uniref:Uncharacterized protein n=1 Tax=Orbilia ellipsospora TaxID=2528407 RepID=A0AAV9WTI9_9PEZI